MLEAAGEPAESRYFASPLCDPFGDPGQRFFLHADGAGTKSIVAYLMFRETGDASWFASLATDSLVMNLDDLACAGALGGLVLSNTIGRNRSCVPDAAVAAIIDGYRSAICGLGKQGIAIMISGGETADIGDVVRTLVVDSTLTARIPTGDLVDAFRVKPGDLIVGFSSTGRSEGELAENSGIGSNGLTLARNVLLSRWHAERYPEVRDPAIPQELGYRGPYRVTDVVPRLGLSAGEALLSPTRSYAPLIKLLLCGLRPGIHSLVHCTGGGQTKIKRFGRGVRFVKDSLFPVPPVFSEIRRCGDIPWHEMYAVFNMGHRLEACVAPEVADECVAIASKLGIEARIVGRVERAAEGRNSVVIDSPHGVFEY